NICQYERIPRGPQGVVKCPLCDTWNVVAETTQIRIPRGAAERNFLVEYLISGDKSNRMRLLNRLSLEGRHYICPQHFHVNALRYIPGLGIFKKAFFLPIHDPNEQIITRVPEPQEDDYVPLLIDGFDNDKVQWTLDYDKVTSVVGETDDEIHQELDDELQATTSFSGLAHAPAQNQEERCNPDVVGGENYCYEQVSGDAEELDADAQIVSVDDEPHVLVEEMPVPEREEVVVTGNPG
ncbi:hypothetical protein OSTOST_13706, partial [Ostertagia ostertagi]